MSGQIEIINFPTTAQTVKGTVSVTNSVNPFEVRIATVASNTTFLTRELPNSDHLYSHSIINEVLFDAHKVLYSYNIGLNLGSVYVFLYNQTTIPVIDVDEPAFVLLIRPGNTAFTIMNYYFNVGIAIRCSKSLTEQINPDVNSLLINMIVRNIN